MRNKMEMNHVLVVEDDKEIISKGRKKALATAVLIAIVCALLCLVVKLALMVATWFS